MNVRLLRTMLLPALLTRHMSSLCDFQAFSNVLRRMLEAAGRGMWAPNAEVRVYCLQSGRGTASLVLYMICSACLTLQL
jgi:cobalamin biosynthesis Mg chelatase CobN